MMVIRYALIGMCIGEVLYLLDSWFLIGGGSTPLILQYIYGFLVVAPLRVYDVLHPNFLNINAIVVFFYGLNGLIASAISNSRISSKFLKTSYFIGIFVLQSSIAILFQ